MVDMVSKFDVYKNDVSIAWVIQGLYEIKIYKKKFKIISFSATEYHLGLLKAKLAKYRSELLEPAKGSAAGKVSVVL